MVLRLEKRVFQRKERSLNHNLLMKTQRGFLQVLNRKVISPLGMPVVDAMIVAEVIGDERR